MAKQPPFDPRTLASGALAGALTALGFAALHHLLISDIWFSFVPMMVAGALCGMCLAWSYRLLFARPSGRAWLVYNLAYVALFVSLGAASFIVYEPITSVAALLSADEPPRDLIAQALPLTIVFTLSCAGVIGLLWGRTLPQLLAVLSTSTVLVFLFGLNISVVGLVQMSGEGVSLLALFFGLVVVIMSGNTGIFWVLERRRLFATADELEIEEGSAAASAASPLEVSTR